MRDELTGSIRKGLQGTRREVTLFRDQLDGLFKQLDLLFPEPQAFAEGDHLVLLIEQHPLKASKVVLSARICDCDDGNGSCYDAARA